MATNDKRPTGGGAAPQTTPGAGRDGFTGWLGRKLVHPIFLFVALLIAALMVRPILYAEGVNPLALWLVGLLVLLAITDLLPSGAGGFPGWLGSRLVHPIFLFVALLLAALMVRPVIYGQAVSGAALWLVGVLILLAFLDLADVSRFSQKQLPPGQLHEIPPLGLVTGSVRALTGLILLVAFFFFLLAAPKIIPDNKEFLEKAVMLIGGWLGVVIGFYFGNRAAEKPPGEKPPAATTPSGAGAPTGPTAPTGAAAPTAATPPTGGTPATGAAGTTGGEGR